MRPNFISQRRYRRWKALTPRPVAVEPHESASFGRMPGGWALTRFVTGLHAGMSSLLGLACVAVLLIGCGQPKGTVKGTPPKGEPRTVLAVLAGDTPSTVTLQGTLVEKCPTAGCWFWLLDGTSLIKVDTKTAGFVVTEIPLRTKVTVGGKVLQEGDQTILGATGLRY